MPNDKIISRITPQAAALAVLNTYLVQTDKFISDLEQRLTNAVAPAKTALSQSSVSFKFELEIKGPESLSNHEVLPREKVPDLLNKALETYVSTAISDKKNPLPAPVQITLKEHEQDGRYFDAKVTITLF